MLTANRKCPLLCLSVKTVSVFDMYRKTTAIIERIQLVMWMEIHTVKTSQDSQQLSQMKREPSHIVLLTYSFKLSYSAIMLFILCKLQGQPHIELYGAGLLF